MKLATELCLIGLAVHATDVSGDNTGDNTDNQTVEGSAGELISHYITGTYNLQAIKYAANMLAAAANMLANAAICLQMQYAADVLACCCTYACRYA